MKPCNRCGAAKSLDEFVRRKTAKDGRDGTCRACRREIDAAYRKDHPDRIAAALRKYRRANPEKNRLHVKKNRAAHPEARRERDRRHRERHPGQAARYTATWREKHRDAAVMSSRMSAARRRALKANALPMVVPATAVTALIAAFDGRCAWCRSPSTAHIDHIDPLSRGGRHEIGNLVPSCAKCNLSKHNKDPRHWAAKCGADLDLIRAKARIDIKSAA